MPVICAGVLVHPGDLILGDDDGVVVVPLRVSEELSLKIPAALAQERQERQAMTDYEPFRLEEELKQRGYSFEQREL